MKKQFFTILMLVSSLSTLAVKPAIKKNNVHHKPATTQVKKEKQTTPQTKKPTLSESWNKVLHFKWSSLSKDDAWNIGGSITVCGILAYLYTHLPKNPANNIVVNPPNNPDPDTTIHTIKPNQKPTIPVTIPAKNEQNPKNNTIPSTDTDEERTCAICFDDKPAHEFCTLSCCGHNTSCTECLTEIIDLSLGKKSAEQMLCPNKDCAKQISEKDIRQFVDPDKYALYDNVALQEWINKNTKHCPTPNCPYAFVNEEKIQQSFTCPKCAHKYCSECLEQHAENITCTQAKEQLKNKNKEEQELNDYLEKNTKECPKCKVRVEKNGGCLCMYCTQCKHMFCWNCRKPHDHTQNHPCGLWDNDILPNINNVNNVNWNNNGQNNWNNNMNNNNGNNNNWQNNNWQRANEIYNALNNVINGNRQANNNNQPNNFNNTFNQPFFNNNLNEWDPF